ncbi:MAG: hypothetical protein ACRDOL_31680 [Streptosporangiaceae bacterium]
MSTPAQEYAGRHRATLQRAVVAIRERAYWTPYPELPGAYGEDGMGRGKAAFDGYLGGAFPLHQLT